MSFNQYQDALAIGVYPYEQILAWAEEKSVDNIHAVDGFAAFYKDNPGTMLMAIRRLSPADLATFACLTLLASEEVTSRVMAIVMPPDSIW